MQDKVITTEFSPEYMRAVMIGGVKDSVSSDVGQYDGQMEAYPLPDTNGTVITDSIAVTAKQAFARYWEGAASVLSASVVNINKRIKTNIFRNTEYPRDPSFCKDCEIGDGIIVSNAGGSFRTKIAGLSGNVVPADADWYPSSGNQRSQTEYVEITRISGTNNSVTPTADITDYDGPRYGAVNAVYYLRVTVGGPPGTAKLRVRNEDEGSYTLTTVNWGEPLTITPRGAKVTFTSNGDNFVVGQEWRLTIRQAFTAPALSVSYTGTVDAMYTISVATGGNPATIEYACDDPAERGTIVISNTSPVSVGSYGLQIAFDRLPLCKGDVYQVRVYKPGIAEITRIITTDPIPSALFGEVTAKIHIVKDKTVDRIRISEPGVFNYMVSSAAVVMNDGVIVYDDSCKSGNNPIPLRVDYCTVNVAYDIWRVGDNELHYVNSLAEIDQIPGKYWTCPVKTATWLAYLMSQNNPVGYVPLSNPHNGDAWAQALRALDRHSYIVVPIIEDSYFVSDIISIILSARAEGQLISVYVPAIIDEYYVKIPKDRIRASFSEGAGGRYNIVTLHGTTTSEISVGDIIRYNFSRDPWGRELYDEDRVTAIIDYQTLKVENGPPGPLSMVDIAVLIHAVGEGRIRIAKDAAANCNSQAVCIVLGCHTEGFWAATAASLAGMRSGNMPTYELRGRLEAIDVDDDLDSETVADLNANGVTCINTHQNGAGAAIAGTVVTSDGRPEQPHAAMDYAGRRLLQRIDSLAQQVGSWEVFAQSLYSVATDELSQLCRQQPYGTVLRSYNLRKISYDENTGKTNVDMDMTPN